MDNHAPWVDRYTIPGGGSLNFRQKNGLTLWKTYVKIGD